jgi:hypothetical protein
VVIMQLAMIALFWLSPAYAAFGAAAHSDQTSGNVRASGYPLRPKARSQRAAAANASQPVNGPAAESSLLRPLAPSRAMKSAPCAWASQ